MIQRKQTLFLIAAAALMALTLLLPLATYFGQGSEFVLGGLGVTDITDPAAPVQAFRLGYLTALLALAALLPLVIVFLYKNRFLQLRLCFAETVLLLGAQGFIAYHVYNFHRSFDVVSWKFGIPSVFPLIALVFVIFAIRAIIRDENLIRSLDRIR